MLGWLAALGATHAAFTPHLLHKLPDDQDELPTPTHLVAILVDAVRCLLYTSDAADE